MCAQLCNFLLLEITRSMFTELILIKKISFPDIFPDNCLLLRQMLTSSILQVGALYTQCDWRREGMLTLPCPLVYCLVFL